MAGSFALTMRRESAIVSGIKDNAGIIAVAEAGIAMAEMMLMHPDQNKRWRTDGNIYEVAFGDTKARIRLLSETGKIDINKAGQPLLQAMMAQAQVDEKQQAKLIGAIMDWRDQDDLLNIEGAEKKEYKDAGLKYQPRNKPFQTVDELQMVLGMDEKVFNWLEPIITVYSGQPQVNLKLATANVLNKLPGLDADMINTFIVNRLESDKNDLPIPEFPGSVLGGATASPNETVTIVSEVQATDETTALVIATVVKSDTATAQSEPFKILKYQRNPANQESLFTDSMSELVAKQYVEPQLSD
ncbi:MAG: general secretion pathway protein GspK [Methyloglobulus sp.]|nr:general secretion pathway protein GspK [Methyloglobulus sp.]